MKCGNSALPSSIALSASTLLVGDREPVEIACRRSCATNHWRRRCRPGKEFRGRERQLVALLRLALLKWARARYILAPPPQALASCRSMKVTTPAIGARRRQFVGRDHGVGGGEEEGLLGFIEIKERLRLRRRLRRGGGALRIGGRLRRCLGKTGRDGGAGQTWRPTKICGAESFRRPSHPPIHARCACKTCSLPSSLDRILALRGRGLWRRSPSRLLLLTLRASSR